MKTNQIMIRDDNRFLQRTKDGYFNANALVSAWNLDNPAKKKEIGEFKRTKTTKDFIEQLKTEGIEKPLIASPKGTWMHSKLFIDFAMWVSIEFKSMAIDYVLDGLINSRNEAGDYYNEMCATILDTYVDYYGTKPDPKIYSEQARMIRQLAGVGNKKRNEMTEAQLELITLLQKCNSVLLKKKIGKASRVRHLKTFSEIGTINVNSLRC